MKPHQVIKSFPSLDMRKLVARRVSGDPVLGKNGIRFYASGRSGLFHIVKCLNVEKSDVVLLPSYHCGVEVEAVLRAGCNVDFFRIRKDLTMDLDNIVDKIDSNTKGIVIAHYFGFPQDISTLKNICREKNVFLIEDCAHALYSKGLNGEWLGMESDFSLFSMRKTFFLPNGGAVLVNRRDTEIPKKGKKYFDLSLLKSTVKSVLEHEMNRRGFVAYISNKILNFYEKYNSNANYSAESIKLNDNRWYYDVPMFDYENDISNISLLLVGKDDFRKIIDCRRRNYEALEQRLKKHLPDDLVFPELPEGACPLCFPLFVKQRDTVVSKMIEKGVEPFVFGRLLHPLLNEKDFPESKCLADNIIGLPVHQQLTAQDIDTVLNALLKSIER